jgi:arylsulfatase A-like enzyme
MPWLENWGDAGHYKARDSESHVTVPAVDVLPNVERLCANGLQMTAQAYTAASTMCGTSRYSAITRRYPSRSSYGREGNRRSLSGQILS